ncbi:transcriptional repressor LexA [Candidatus Magnetomonas plexicatena]|uniref:transcriptional repressor LexA n=1 Tax=Candidatus Magnetomonas plexicatena TaxID=2552947 RepID=UPI001C759611|nr:repressor LexA [Nitrospirales bacterium LBB_01]
MAGVGKEMTLRQSEVLEFIKGHITTIGYPPTIREICSQFGFSSPVSAKHHVDALKRKGYLRQEPLKQRALEVSGMRMPNLQKIPLIGTIRAGHPILAVEDIEEYLDIDASLFNLTSGFALKVKGDSMKDAGILEGDIVFVDKDRPVANGDIGIALIGDEATVKRIYREGATVRLVPENKDMEALTVAAPDVQIIGKVAGVVRRF